MGRFFYCENVHGVTIRLTSEHGCFGLQHTGFEWRGVELTGNGTGGEELAVYTDALHASRYIFEASSMQLLELYQAWELLHQRIGSEILGPSWTPFAKDIFL